MSEHLQIDHVTHRFGRVTALDDVDLRIREGEFITLLGPSGCGKTTLLRAIAGFERPTAGRIVLDGRDITRVPAHRRPLNMVFQRSTLFPHLDVHDNVAFGLRVAGTPRAEAGERVREALALVQLGQLERRRSHELSGGQMQRVALARALVNRPRVLLLDEPLSALDLKIRLEMEVELRRVHRETGATFVYVTHDQREALALSDRIVVLNDGRIEQVGPPDALYRRPASPFAARFVGDANVLPAVVERDGDGAEIQVGVSRLRAPAGDAVDEGPAWLVVRPEAVRIGPPNGDAGGRLRGVVRDFAFRGTGYSYRIEVGGLAEMIKAETPADAPPRAVGDEVTIGWPDGASSLLPREPA